MIFEGLNININDIEDDDLRKKVIKYFKTFKKGKLEDENLDEVTDDEEKKDDIESEYSEELSEIKNMSDDDIVSLINSMSKEEIDEMISELKEQLKNEDLSDEDKNNIKEILEFLSKDINENLIEEATKSIGAKIKDVILAYPRCMKAAIKRKRAIKNKKKEAKKVEKDEDGNVLKQEEITDKDGKKKKVTTHTGPRGGKFYWPDGAPKDAKHKVYIGKDGKVKECMDLSDYLYESFK